MTVIGIYASRGPAQRVPVKLRLRRPRRTPRPGSAASATAVHSGQGGILLLLLSYDNSMLLSSQSDTISVLARVPTNPSNISDGMRCSSNAGAVCPTIFVAVTPPMPKRRRMSTRNRSSNGASRSATDCSQWPPRAVD